LNNCQELRIVIFASFNCKETNCRTLSEGKDRFLNADIWLNLDLRKEPVEWGQLISLTLNPSLTSMSIKFPVSAITIATMLTVAHSSIAFAEVYKTSTNQVVVTGLTAKQKYEVKTVSAKDKAGKRQVTANTCGEALVSNATKYKSLVVGTETIDPTTLATKVHARCAAKKTPKVATPTPTMTPAAN
jgi:hypothetical protein